MLYALWLSTILVVVATAETAPPQLTVEVTGPSKINDVANLQVTTKVKNIGHVEVKLLNEPRSVLSSFPADSFVIRHETSGLSSQFTGAMFKYIPHLALGGGNSSVTVLRPGDSKTTQHNLSGIYNFTIPGEGIYTIDAYPRILSWDSRTNTSTSIVATSTLAHKINMTGKLSAPSPRERIGKSRPSIASKRSVSFVGCNSNQQSSVNNAIPYGVTYAINSNNVATNNAGNAYWVEWFGSYTFSHAIAVANVYRWLVTTYFGDYTYDCTCPGGSSGTVAYVYRNIQGYIYLCSAFWSLPRNGQDSQAGTLIHEATHWATTSDYAYGPSAARSLAITDSNFAVVNADNFQFYSEGTA